MMSQGDCLNVIRLKLTRHQTPCPGNVWLITRQQMSGTLLRNFGGAVTKISRRCDPLTTLSQPPAEPWRPINIFVQDCVNGNPRNCSFDFEPLTRLFIRSIRSGHHCDSCRNKQPPCPDPEHLTFSLHQIVPTFCSVGFPSYPFIQPLSSILQPPTSP